METWAAVTVSKNGVQQALKISELCKEKIDLHVYTLEKYYTKGVTKAGNDLKEIIAEVYHSYKTILFIMASGIVVRMIAPHIQSKLKDPAILVMDDKGKFIISLLSGHVGGANEDARVLSQMINATPVITTASDVNGKMAVDTFAIKHNLCLTDFNRAKEITAMILNGDSIALINEEDISIQKDSLCDNVTILKDKVRYLAYDGIILISQKENIELDIPYVQLMSKDLVFGIGCKKDTPADKIIDFILEIVHELNISIYAVSTLSTVDVKKEEKGLIEASERLGLELDIIWRDEIAKHEDKFKKSDFVKKTIGVGNVSEPCGYISSKGGHCLLNRRAKNGITLSLWKKNKEAYYE